jgi:hypothetical protein
MADQIPPGWEDAPAAAAAPIGDLTLPAPLPARYSHLGAMSPLLLNHPWVQQNMAVGRGETPTRDEKINMLTTAAQAATVPLGGWGAGALASRLGATGVGLKAAPYAGRILGSAAPPMVAAPAKGENPLAAGAQAAAAATAAEGLVPLGTNVLQAVKPLASKVDMARLGDAVGKALPEFVTRNRTELYDLAKRGVGQKIRSSMLGTELGSIGQTVGVNTALPVPSLPQGTTLQEAIKALTEARERAFPANAKLLGLEDSQRVKGAQEAWRQLRNEIPKALDQLSPGAGQRFNDAYALASAQAAYLKLTSRAMTKDGVLDTRKLMGLINENPERWASQFGPYWDTMRSALLRGGQVGEDVDRALGGHGINRLGENVGNLLFRRLKGPEAPFVAGPGTRALADLAAQNPYVQAGMLGTAESAWNLLRHPHRTVFGGGEEHR